MKYHTQLKMIKSNKGICIPLYKTKKDTQTDSVLIPNVGEIKDGNFILSPLLDLKSESLCSVLAEHFINHRGVYGIIKKNLPQMILSSEKVDRDEVESAHIEPKSIDPSSSMKEKLVQEMMVL